MLTWTKCFIAVMSLSLLRFVYVKILFWHDSDTQSAAYSDGKEHFPSPPKKILVWFNGNWNPLMPESYKDYKCSHSCITSFTMNNDESLFSSADAIVVVFVEQPIFPEKLEPLLALRRPFIPVILAGREALASGAKLRNEAFNDLFHATMTPRLKSTIYFPYGFVLPKDKDALDTWKIGSGEAPEWPEFKPPNSELLSLPSKPKDILWVVSHCKVGSKRSEFAEKLQKALLSSNLHLDQFGKCNENPLPGWNTVDETLYEQYSFYLSFENNLCRHYITEKFFKVLRSDRIIPIVRGAPRRDYESVAPPHSFIHVDDFKTIDDLAAHLKYLKDNVTAFNEYFWWKDGFEVHLLSFSQNNGLESEIPEGLNPLCRLCGFVNSFNASAVTPVGSFYKYWSMGDKYCVNPSQ